VDEFSHGSVAAGNARWFTPIALRWKPRPRNPILGLDEGHVELAMLEGAGARPIPDSNGVIHGHRHDPREEVLVNREGFDLESEGTSRSNRVPAPPDPPALRASTSRRLSLGRDGPGCSSRHRRWPDSYLRSNEHDRRLLDPICE
jgi:hypothetical protein